MVLWLLGLAALLSGVAAIVLVFGRARRRRARSVPAPPQPAIDPEPAAEAPPPQTKICPACGSRYAAGYRTCARDQSDLAALH